MLEIGYSNELKIGIDPTGKQQRGRSVPPSHHAAQASLALQFDTNMACTHFWDIGKVKTLLTTDQTQHRLEFRSVTTEGRGGI